MAARIDSSGPSKRTSTTRAMRRTSASAAGLSGDVSAVISVIPARRASRTSSAARATPTPLCWYSSATAKAISALPRVVRELALGVHRFDQIQRNTGAPRDILTNRLRRLEDAGVVERQAYQERPLRNSYHLTESGNELRPILLTLSQWGEKWTAQVNAVDWVHTCGEIVDVTHTCRAC